MLNLGQMFGADGVWSFTRSVVFVLALATVGCGGGNEAGFPGGAADASVDTKQDQNAAVQTDAKSDSDAGGDGDAGILLDSAKDSGPETNADASTDAKPETDGSAQVDAQYDADGDAQADTQVGAEADAPEDGSTVGDGGGDAPSDTPGDADCGLGQTDCGGSCVSLASDPANCGACGHACASTDICSGGTCVLNCVGGLSPCSGVCVDLQADPWNCGTCGTTCIGGTVCISGTCLCPPGQTSCGGVCVNLANDGANCGACSKLCTGGTICVAGTCECLPGQTLCNGTCVDLTLDLSNCGVCGKVCAVGSSCMNGLCCKVGELNCAGACVNPKVDPANCGACGTVCTGGQICSAGACICPVYQKLCSGVCKLTNVDPNNCGACGVKCPPGQACSAGACSTTCLPGLKACAGVCVDLQSDSANCGTCGHQCAPGTGCVEGACKPSLVVGPPPAKCVGGGPPIIIQYGTVEECSGNQAQTTFLWALCSCDFVKFGTSAAFDAYDSTKGPYKAPGELGGGLGYDGTFSSTGPLSVSGALWSSTSAGLSASSNAKVMQELHLGGPLSTGAPSSVGWDGYVAGNVTATASLVFGQALRQPVNASVSGPVTYASLFKQPVTVPPPCKCGPSDLIPVGAIVAARKSPNNDNPLIGLNPDAFTSPTAPQHLDLPCGNYYLSKIDVGGAPLSIVAHGKTALYVDGDVIANTLTLALDPTAEFDVFVAGTILTSGNATIGSPNYPRLSRTYVGSPQTLLLAGNTTVGGYIYAAYSPVVINSPFEIYGGLYSGSYANIGAETSIHYDRAVLDAGYECPPPPQTCGSCADCGNQACISGLCGACTSSSQCCPPLICVNGTCSMLLY
ncbi:MAG: hypothetical protein HY898_05420 [Deltaproteobacteria bacterium]|nr:hypothetical protein [Deltaproteobacteria bacterium]